jgi:signal transduction histidine kinase
MAKANARTSMSVVSILRRPGTREAVWLTLGLWIACYAVFLIPSAAEGKLEPFKFAMFGLIALAGMVLSIGFYPLIRSTNSWGLRRRLALFGFAVLAAATLQSLFDAEMIVLFFSTYANKHPAFEGAALYAFLIYVWLYGLYATALGLMLSRLDMQERERQLAQARAAAHQAQLAALRFQLNPHFLFNTLNAISSLIVTNRNVEAEAMTAKLSDFLRASLASDPQSVITLGEELATVRAYLDIESVRFGARLAVEVACPDDLLDALTPSFVLQPLVENAVKYAAAPARRRVRIEVSAAERDGDLVLMVEDDGDVRTKNQAAPGTGVGLQNVRKRLEVLYGVRGVIEAGRLPGGGFRAALRFPLERTATNQFRSVA